MHLLFAQLEPATKTRMIGCRTAAMNFREFIGHSKTGPAGDPSYDELVCTTQCKTPGAAMRTACDLAPALAPGMGITAHRCCAEPRLFEILTNPIPLDGIQKNDAPCPRQAPVSRRHLWAAQVQLKTRRRSPPFMSGWIRTPGRKVSQKTGRHERSGLLDSQTILRTIYDSRRKYAHNAFP